MAEAELRATPPCSRGYIPHPHPRGEILGQFTSDSVALTHANGLEAAVIRREEGERGREGVRRQAQEKPSLACRRANYFKRIRFALVKLKTISFSVIKQIIAHQKCWARGFSPAPVQGPRWAGRWECQGRGPREQEAPEEGQGRTCGEINVPTRTETALCPPCQAPLLTRERL